MRVGDIAKLPRISAGSGSSSRQDHLPGEGALRCGENAEIETRRGAGAVPRQGVPFDEMIPLAPLSVHQAVDESPRGVDDVEPHRSGTGEIEADAGRRIERVRVVLEERDGGRSGARVESRSREVAEMDLVDFTVAVSRLRDDGRVRVPRENDGAAPGDVEPRASAVPRAGVGEVDRLRGPERVGRQREDEVVLLLQGAAAPHPRGVDAERSDRRGVSDPFAGEVEADDDATAAAIGELFDADRDAAEIERVGVALRLDRNDLGRDRIDGARRADER
jgi:hypothetical protein